VLYALHEPRCHVGTFLFFSSRPTRKSHAVCTVYFGKLYSTPTLTRSHSPACVLTPEFHGISFPRSILVTSSREVRNKSCVSCSWTLEKRAALHLSRPPADQSGKRVKSWTGKSPDTPPDTHDLLRGCHEDATRKTVPWNLSLTEGLRIFMYTVCQNWAFYWKYSDKCLSVCPLAYPRNHTAKLREIEIFVHDASGRGSVL